MRTRSIFVIVLASALAGPALPARATSGHLDTTFGDRGKVLTKFEGGAAAYDVALQGDGKIVAVGRAGSPNVDWALARYDRNGTLDTTFGHDGRVTTGFDRFEFAAGVAIQPNGKIVAVGGVGGGFAVARYRTNGIPDPAFGGDGTVFTSFADAEADATEVAIQPDGKILVVGSTRSLTCCPATGMFALARYNADGTPDTFFSANGKVTTAVTGTYDSATDLAIQTDGSIVAVGYGDSRFEVVRYTTDGSLDATFSGDGITFAHFTSGDDSAGAVAIQPDGRIVVAGDAGGIGEYTSSFALARYNTDGTLDATFDGNGKVVTDFTIDDDGAADVAIQADGKIVTAGSAGFNGASASFALARYDADGTLDLAFNGDGKVTTSFTGGFDFARGMAIQANGKIVAAGSAGVLVAKLALARYLG